MKCPDCKKEVGFNKDYCPHCSGELFNRRGQGSAPARLISPAGFKNVAIF
jgi:predicted amidophosphoribosyltransferase